MDKYTYNLIWNKRLKVGEMSHLKNEAKRLKQSADAPGKVKKFQDIQDYNNIMNFLSWEHYKKLCHDLDHISDYLLDSDVISLSDYMKYYSTMMRNGSIDYLQNIKERIDHASRALKLIYATAEAVEAEIRSQGKHNIKF